MLAIELDSGGTYYFKGGAGEEYYVPNIEDARLFTDSAELLKCVTYEVETGGRFSNDGVRIVEVKMVPVSVRGL